MVPTMTQASVRTSNVPAGSSIAEVLGNEDLGGGAKRTVRVATAILANALAPYATTLTFDTRANLFASLDYPANTGAYVWADSTTSYRGVYRKSGSSGSGSWTKVSDLATVLTASQLDAKADVTALEAEAAARTAAIAAAADESNISAVTDLHRPGERPAMWSDDIVGAPSALTPLADSVTRQDGAAIAVTGAGTRAPRWVLRLEPGRVYRIRFVVRRTTNSPDPANDAVNLSVQWMNSAKSAISTTTLASLTDLTTGSGRVEHTFNISTASGAEVDAVAASGTIYARPYVETFGLLCVTDIEVISALDITEWGIYAGGDLTSLDSRVDALESLDAGDRLDVIEAAIDGTKIQRFATYADASGATLLDTTEIVETLGYTGPGDGGGAQYIPSVTEPSHAGKLETAGGVWWEIANAIISPEMLGALGDGTTDDKPAFTDALTIGRPVIGNPIKTYAVDGNLSVPDDTHLENIHFKQLTHDGGDRRTIFGNSVDRVKLINVTVDRNGDGTYGGFNDDAGIWLASGEGHLLDRVTVFGDDMGNGIAMQTCTDFLITRTVVRDMAYDLVSDPGDDRVQGILVNNCSDFTISETTVHDLGGDYGSGSTTKWSRGIAFGGCSDFIVYASKAYDIDQGFDVTGGVGNRRYRFIGCEVRDGYTWGFKAANTAINGTYVGCHAYRCGYAGFVASGPAADALPSPQNITYLGCKSVDTGSNGIYAANNPSGFLVLVSAYDTSRPRPVRFIGCEAIDGQNTPTMVYGFRNQVGVATSGAPFNECVDCTAVGFTAEAITGFNYPAAKLSRDTNYSVAHNTATAVPWSTEAYDGAQMHSTSSNLEVVTVPRNGWYRCVARVTFATNATGDRWIAFNISGTRQNHTMCFGVGSAGRNTLMTEATFYLQTGNTIYVEAFQNSGGSLDIEWQYSSFEVTEALSNRTSQ